MFCTGLFGERVSRVQQCSNIYSERSLMRGQLQNDVTKKGESAVNIVTSMITCSPKAQTDLRSELKVSSIRETW